MLIAHTANYDRRFISTYLSQERPSVNGSRILSCQVAFLYKYIYQAKHISRKIRLDCHHDFLVKRNLEVENKLCHIMYIY